MGGATLGHTPHPGVRASHATTNGDGRASAVTTVMAISSNVDGLDDLLSIRPVVWSDFCTLGGCSGGEGGRRGTEGLKISSFGNCRVLEDDVQASVVDPFDFKPSLDVVPVRKGLVNVFRPQLLRKPGY